MCRICVYFVLIVVNQHRAWHMRKCVWINCEIPSDAKSHATSVMERKIVMHTDSIKRILCVKIFHKKKPTSSTLHGRQRGAIVYVGRFHSQFISSAQKCSLPCVGLFKHDTSSLCNFYHLSGPFHSMPLFARQKNCTNFYSGKFCLSIHEGIDVEFMVLIRCWTQFFIQIMFGVVVAEAKWELFYIVGTLHSKQMNFSIARWLKTTIESKFASRYISQFCHCKQITTFFVIQESCWTSHHFTIFIHCQLPIIYVYIPSWNSMEFLIPWSDDMMENWMNHRKNWWW